MAKERQYEIPTWSHKEFTARKNYTCDNCRGIITKGTTYLRNVVRRGENKGVDPLRNIHLHLDCTAPWFHPEMDDRCRNLRQLPGRMPPREARNEQVMDASVCISFTSPELGRMTWELPKDAAIRLLHAKTSDLRVGARAELQQNMLLTAFALLQAMGNRKRGMKVNNAFNGIQLALDYMPELNYDLDLGKLELNDD